MWAAQQAVLRKADTGVRNKLSCFNLADRRFHQVPELLTMLFRDRDSQILDFGTILPYEYDQCYFRNPTDPGITDELRVEREQALRVSKPQRSALRGVSMRTVRMTIILRLVVVMFRSVGGRKERRLCRVYGSEKSNLQNELQQVPIIEALRLCGWAAILLRQQAKGLHAFQRFFRSTFLVIRESCKTRG